MNYFDILLAKKLENDKDVSIVQLNVSENGTYSESGKAYSPVVVDVQPPPNSYLKTPIDSYPATAQQLPIPKCDVTITNQKSCQVLVSDKPFVNDKIPYLFRKSAGGNGVVAKIIGGTIAWNQLVVASGSFSFDRDTQRTRNFSTSNVIPVIGHKYFFSMNVVSENLTGSMHAQYGGNLDFTHGTGIKNAIYSASTATPNSVYVYVYMALDESSGAQATIKDVMVIDLTAMFGSTIADHIYSLEQATAGAGVAWFRALFPNDYYAYDSGSLQSVNVASKKVYDSNNTLVATYAFDSDLTLRGIPKLDANNNLYYDGDTYESDGTVTRRYGIVDLGALDYERNTSYDNPFFYAIIDGIGSVSFIKPKINIFCSEKYLVVDSTSMNRFGASADNNTICKEIGAARKKILIRDDSYTDAQAFKTAMSGIYLVYELATPTTESADAYINPQIVDADGTEEFVDYGVEQETRDVAVPVGHESLYYNGQLYQTDFEQATTGTIKMAELHSIVPPSGEFYMASNGTLSVDVWKK